MKKEIALIFAVGIVILTYGSYFYTSHKIERWQVFYRDPVAKLCFRGDMFMYKDSIRWIGSTIQENPKDTLPIEGFLDQTEYGYWEIISDTKVFHGDSGILYYLYEEKMIQYYEGDSVPRIVHMIRDEKPQVESNLKKSFIL